MNDIVVSSDEPIRLDDVAERRMNDHRTVRKAIPHIPPYVGVLIAAALLMFYGSIIIGSYITNAMYNPGMEIEMIYPGLVYLLVAAILLYQTYLSNDSGRRRSMTLIFAIVLLFVGLAIVATVSDSYQGWGYAFGQYLSMSMASVVFMLIGAAEYFRMSKEEKG